MQAFPISEGGKTQSFGFQIFTLRNTFPILPFIGRYPARQKLKR